MNWYYASNGTQKGPLPTEDLKSRLAMGEVAPTDLAWREGMSDWMPISSIPELKVEEAPPKPVHPTMPAGGFPSSTPQPEPYQAPAAAPAPAPMGGAPTLPPSQGLSIASMVCGILAIISCCLLGPLNAPLVIAALVLGHIALSKIKSDPQRTGGKGMAKAGLVTGYIGLVGLIFIVVIIALAGSMDPRVIQEKMIQMFPQDMQQQMREQMEQQQQQMQKK